MRVLYHFISTVHRNLQHRLTIDDNFDGNSLGTLKKITLSFNRVASSFNTNTRYIVKIY